MKFNPSACSWGAGIAFTRTKKLGIWWDLNLGPLIKKPYHLITIDFPLYFFYTIV